MQPETWNPPPTSCWVRLNADPEDYPSVQAAVDASTRPTDVVKVAGYCAGVGQRDGVTQTVFLSKTLTLQGGYTTTNWTTPDPLAHPTTLDAGGDGRVLFVAGAVAPTVAGLRLVGGDAGRGGGGNGGGVHVVTAALTISHCAILSGTAAYGGGLYTIDSDTALVDSTVAANRADYIGGGVLLVHGSSSVVGNTIVGNTADTGGGIYVGSDVATVTANLVASNTATLDGGGLIMEIYGYRATLTANTISANEAGWRGGGLYFGEPVAAWEPPRSAEAPRAVIALDGNQIDHNRAQLDGGGVFMGGDGGTPTLIGNFVRGNVAQRDGGGVYLDWSSEATTIGANQIAQNVAQRHGGGICLGNRGATLRDNAIVENQAYDSGGGVYGEGILRANVVLSNTAGCDGGGLHGGGALAGNLFRANQAGRGGGLYLEGATLTNTLVAENRTRGAGSGLYVAAGPTHLLHTTLADNGLITPTAGAGSGVHVAAAGAGGTTVALTNTILVSHVVGITVTAGNTATLAATLWGNDLDWGGAGTVITPPPNLWGDPAFVDPGGGDYHIAPSSAAVDGGLPTAVTTDVDGDPRPAGHAPDLGADEVADYLLLPQKSASSTILNPGQHVHYTIAITSAGAFTPTAVALLDRLPGEQRARSVDSDWGTCQVQPRWGGGTTCDLGAMPPGTVAHVTLTAQVTSTVPPALPHPMHNALWISATETAGQAALGTWLQNCHVRLNDLATPYTTVQGAVDAASAPTDVVKVAGYCLGVNGRGSGYQQVYLSRTLTLQGGYTTTDWTRPDPARYRTTLDAQRRGRVLFAAGGGATIAGLYLTGGDAAGLGGGPAGEDAGGGVYLAGTTLVLSNTVLLSNTATYGGGGYLAGGAPTLVANRIEDNRADQGGGLYLYESAAGLAGNTIEDNRADYLGGGVLTNRSPVSLTANFLLTNRAPSGAGLAQWEGQALLATNLISGNVAVGLGGGLYVESGTVSLQADTIAANRGSYGGGMALYRGTAALVNATVVGNEATARGGGCYIGTASALWAQQATMARNGPAGSLAGGRPPVLEQVGAGSGLYVDRGASAAVACTNTILVSHTVGVYVRTGQSASLEGTLWGSGPWGNQQDWAGGGTVATGTVNLWGDPDFVAPEQGDYHIGPHSAAIDAGVDTGVPVDVDSQARPAGRGYDIGADEVPVGLEVTKVAAVDPVESGAALSYTIGLSNSGLLPLQVTISDVLPAQVTPTGVLTWAVQITPGGRWSTTAAVTIETGYVGPLRNRLLATAMEGVEGATTVTATVVDAPIAGLRAIHDAPTPLGQATTFTAVVRAGTNVTFTWDLGDGTRGYGAVVSHVYTASALYTAAVTASNSVGTLTATCPVSVIRPVYRIYLPFLTRQSQSQAGGSHHKGRK